MDLRNMILNANPQTNLFSKTLQYKLSRQLMKERYKSNLSLDKISEMLGLTNNEYGNLEFGDTEIAVEEYERYLNKIIDYNLQKREVVSFEINLNSKVSNNSTFIDSVFYTNTNKSHNYKMSSLDYDIVKVAS